MQTTLSYTHCIQLEQLGKTFLQKKYIHVIKTQNLNFKTKKTCTQNHH